MKTHERVCVSEKHAAIPRGLSKPRMGRMRCQLAPGGRGLGFGEDELLRLAESVGHCLEMIAESAASGPPRLRLGVEPGPRGRAKLRLSREPGDASTRSRGLAGASPSRGERTPKSSLDGPRVRFQIRSLHMEFPAPNAFPGHTSEAPKGPDSIAQGQ